MQVMARAAAALLVDEGKGSLAQHLDELLKPRSEMASRRSRRLPLEAVLEASIADFNSLQSSCAMPVCRLAPSVRITLGVGSRDHA